MTAFGSLPAAQMIDGIIAVLVLEIAVLAGLRAFRGSGMRPGELMAFHGAGLSMLVALRVAASDGPFAAFAAAMLVSLGLHLWHVRQRWQRRAGQTGRVVAK